ncbi:MAG TPA: DUF1990 domain-containing protein [Vicinamibacterales bacterium]
MFFARRPSPAAIDRFVRGSQDLPLSYEPIGIVRGDMPYGELDEAAVAIGRGKRDFERARAALTAWKQFDIGWVELFPRHAPVAVGTVVAVLIHHLGFWSLNGCRVLYAVGSGEGDRFGFAYGTLTNHAQSGEELFDVFLDPESGEVRYRIRAMSRPQAALARMGQPIARALQRRFRRDSAAAMKRAIEESRSEL